MLFSRKKEDNLFQILETNKIMNNAIKTFTLKSISRKNSRMPNIIARI